MKLVLIGAVAVVLVIIVLLARRSSTSKRGEGPKTERFRSSFDSQFADINAPPPVASTSSSSSGPPRAFEPVSEGGPTSFSEPTTDGFPSGSSNSAAAPALDRIQPSELLPKDAANSAWAKANPAGQGDVMDQNFLTAGYHMGFDTQGSSLRNPNYDIRSTPPAPRYRVSIWQQSTIEPDLSRRPLE